MKVLLGYHPAYFCLIPNISFGRGWLMLDWMFNCIEFKILSLP